MRRILGYEGDGRARRAMWSDNEPSAVGPPRRPSREMVVGRSERELHREQSRQAKARKAAAT